MQKEQKRKSFSQGKDAKIWKKCSRHPEKKEGAWNTFIGKTSPDYFWQQSVAVLSHCLQHSSCLSQPAHFVESQHSFWQSSFLSQSAQHSVAAFSAFFELLQQLHEAAANIAATIAIVINTFFMIISFNGLTSFLRRIY